MPPPDRSRTPPKNPGQKIADKDPLEPKPEPELQSGEDGGVEGGAIGAASTEGEGGAIQAPAGGEQEGTDQPPAGAAAAIDPEARAAIESLREELGKQAGQLREIGADARWARQAVERGQS